MFLNCNKIIKINLSNFDCSEALSCEEMFSGCESLKKINLGLLDFSLSKNFEKMFKMFYNCKNLIYFKFKTNNCISFESMYEEYSKVKEINISKFNTSNCEKICYLFKGCKNITKIDMLNWDMSKIKVDKKMENSSNKNTVNYLHEGIYQLFYGCEKLNEIKMNLNFKDIKELQTYEAFTNISKNGTFIYNKIKDCEIFLKLLPENWSKRENFNIYNLAGIYGLGAAIAPFHYDIRAGIGAVLSNLFD